MIVKFKTKRTSGQDLEATIQAVLNAVVAWYRGQAPTPKLPANMSKKHTRWAPSFVAGAKPDLVDAVPYSAKAVSVALGNVVEQKKNKSDAHPLVLLSLILLQLLEENKVTVEQIQELYTGNWNVLHALRAATKLRDAKPKCKNQKAPLARPSAGSAR